MRRTAVDVAIGAVGALMLAFAVSSWITTSLTGEPGSMSTGLGLLFGAIAVEVVMEHRAEQRARVAATPVRDLEDELVDAYWAWQQDQGGRQEAYTGDKTEWWSLDPDGDGRRDQDAPVLRVLRDPGPTARRVSLFDSDADLVVDQVQWTVSLPASAVTVWCAPVNRPPTGILSVRWHLAEPRACDAPASTQVSAGS